MRVNKEFVLIIFIIVCFWLQYHLGGLYYLFLLIVITFIAFDLTIFTRTFKNKAVIAITILIILSYILNVKNINLVANNHLIKTGNYIPLLYLRIIGNTFVLFIFIIFSYSFGYKIIHKKDLMIRFFNALNIIFFINSLVAIGAWLVTTGGVISRYNFYSPIDNSLSSSATYAVWGILLTLALKDKSKIYYVFFGVFLLNLLIVVTRLTQVVFIISLGYYFLLNIKHARNKVLKYFILVFIAIITSLIIGIVFSTVYSSYYSTMFSKGSYDILSRQSSIIAAIDIFIHHPILGVGYGMFGPYNLISFRGFILESAHNGFFSILSELGIIGVLVIIYFFLTIFKSTSSKVIVDEDKRKVNIRNVCIINLRIMIFTFPLANIVMLPPPSERTYYFSCLIMWVMYGVVQGQFDEYRKIKV